MTLYDNEEICPVCGSPLKRVEYYSGRVVCEDGEPDTEAAEARVAASAVYEDIRMHYAGYCSNCSRKSRERSNAAVAEDARRKLRLYLILSILSAAIAAAGVIFEIWCRRSLRDIGSERWILGGLGTFIALAFIVLAGVFFFLRPVEKLKLSGKPYIEPDYNTLSRSAAIQAGAAHMEEDPKLTFFSVEEYRKMRGL